MIYSCNVLKMLCVVIVWLKQAAQDQAKLSETK